MPLDLSTPLNPASPDRLPSDFYTGVNFLGRPTSLSLTGSERGAGLAAGGVPTAPTASATGIASSAPAPSGAPSPSVSGAPAAGASAVTGVRESTGATGASGTKTADFFRKILGLTEAGLDALVKGERLSTDFLAPSAEFAAPAGQRLTGTFTDERVPGVTFPQFEPAFLAREQALSSARAGISTPAESISAESARGRGVATGRSGLSTVGDVAGLAAIVAAALGQPEAATGLGLVGSGAELGAAAAEASATGLAGGAVVPAVGALLALRSAGNLISGDKERAIEARYGRAARRAFSDLAADPGVRSVGQSIAAFRSGDRAALEPIQQALIKATQTGVLLTQPSGSSSAPVNTFLRGLYANVGGTPDYGPTLVAVARSVAGPDLADRLIGQDASAAYDYLNQTGVHGPSSYGPPPGYRGDNPTGEARPTFKGFRTFSSFEHPVQAGPALGAGIGLAGGFAPTVAPEAPTPAPAPPRPRPPAWVEGVGWVDPQTGRFLTNMSREQAQQILDQPTPTGAFTI